MVVQDISEQGVWAARLDTGQVEVGIYRSDISTVPGSQASVFAPFFWPDKAAGTGSRMGGPRLAPPWSLIHSCYHLLVLGYSAQKIKKITEMRPLINLLV